MACRQHIPPACNHRCSLPLSPSNCCISCAPSTHSCLRRVSHQTNGAGFRSELQLTFKDSIPGASKRRTVVKSSGSNVNLMRAECYSCFEYLYGHLESSQRDSVDGMRTPLFLSLCSGKGHSSYLQVWN